MIDEEIRSNIFAELRKIAPESDPSAVPESANIREALDIDSYDFLQFLIAISEKLGVNVPEKDYSRFVTIDGMVRYLSAHMQR